MVVDLDDFIAAKQSFGVGDRVAGDATDDEGSVEIATALDSKSPWAVGFGFS